MHRIKPIKGILWKWLILIQQHKHTKWSGTRTKEDGKRSQTGLTAFDDHAEQSKRKRTQTKFSQAGRHAIM